MAPEWSEFDALVAPKQIRECVVARYLAELPEDGREALQRALDGGRSVERIREALRVMRPGHGVPGWTSFQRHRNGQCPCSQASK